MLTASILGLLIDLFGLILSLLPSISLTIPDNVFNYIISCIDNFGALLPAKTVITILGCEFAYHTFMFTGRMVNYVVRKLPFI